MSTFWDVLGTILLALWGLALIAGVMGGAGVAIVERQPRLWLIPLASVILMAITITILINTGLLDFNDSQHCGEGTHYVTYGSGKSSDWRCEVGIR